MLDEPSQFAVCITVLLIGVGFALSPVAASEHGDRGDTVLNDGETYFVGQELYTDTFESGDDIQLRRGTSDNDRGFVTQVQPFSNGDVVLRTERRSADRYYLTDGQGTTLEFDLVHQTYSVSPSQSTVTNSGANSSVSITVDSNRANYSQELRSPDLTASELDAVLGGVGAVESGGEAVSISGTPGQSLSANLSGFPPGTYQINFAVPDTTAAETVTISVEAAATGEVSFAAPTKVVQAQVGSVAEIPLRFSGTNRAMLTIGSRDLNWKVSMTVTDTDGDGTATVYTNTTNIRQDGEVFTARNSGSVSNISIKVGSKFSSPTRRIAATAYPMSVKTDGKETDVATLSLTDPTSKICDRETDHVIQKYENNVERAPGVLSGPITDATIHGIVNNDPVRDYIIETGPDKRISEVKQGVPANPAIEVETDCQTFHKVLDTDDPAATFGTEYDNGNIRVRGVGSINTVLVEVLKIGLKISRTLGLG